MNIRTALLAPLALAVFTLPALAEKISLGTLSSYLNSLTTVEAGRGLTAEAIGAAGRVTRQMVVADCDYVGEGYGLIDQGVIDALTLAARTEGLLLDPVYSGKAMKGLIDQARKGAFKGERVVFLHTGGAQGLFGYHTQLEPALL